MNIDIKNNDIIVSNVPCFNLANTLDSGQCFRYEKIGEDDYLVNAHRQILNIKQNGDCLIFHNTTKEDFENIYLNYFALKEDYPFIIDKISNDDWIKEAINNVNGIRILHQEPYEMIISFIISANNNIPRIKKIIAGLCKAYGQEIEYNNKIYYSFPTSEELRNATINELRGLGLGYRDTYIYETVKKFNDGSFNIEEIKALETSEAKKELLNLKGVGDKVSDCILLFGFSRYEVCPHDVWVKRIFTSRYGIEEDVKKSYAFAREKWGEYAGIAQQYLFTYEREQGR